MKKIGNILGGHTLNGIFKHVRAILSTKAAKNILDVNGDGKVDFKDIEALRQKSIGELILWIVTALVVLESNGIINIL